MDASGYLYTIATVGMTFTGLSVLTMILRQMLGGRMTKFDSFVARTWVELGFMTTFGSILPPLLMLFAPPAPIAWRISSGLMAVILGWWALTFPRRRLAVNPTRFPGLLSRLISIVAVAFERRNSIFLKHWKILRPAAKAGDAQSAAARK